MAGAREDHPRDPFARVIRRSRAAMALESFTRAFWPLGTLAAAVWAAFAFGLAEVARREVVLAVLAVSGAAALWLAWRGIRRMRWPSRAAALARVDADLPGRPLAALGDNPALGRDDPAAMAVWSAHLARMREAARRARAARPDLRLAAWDPWALRLGALVALIAALVFAPDRRIESMAGVLAPEAGAQVAAGPSFEGWAEPPAYTGRPTLYLPEVSGDAPVPLPQGTVVTLRAYGETADFALTESVSGTAAPIALADAAPGIAAAEFTVARSGAVTLGRGETELGAWSFTMERDAPPEIDLAGPVERAMTGETRLPFVARDDFGVVAGRAEIRLDLPAVDRRHGLAVAPEDRPPLVAELPMPMTGSAGEVAETLIEDFSKHPWVGLPVTITLVAEDALDQVGQREGIAVALPGRRFYDPIAAALIEQRRDLLWSAENGRRVGQILRAVTNRPDGFFDSPRAYLVVRTAIRRLDQAAEADRVAAVRDEIAEALWQAALLLEEGSLGDAAERLAEAKERLSEALRNDASDEEIAELMEQLREAARDYMEQMAQQAIDQGEMEMSEMSPGETMSQDQIQELMDRIEELSQQGRKAEAQALLEMLQQMLDSMEMMMAQGAPGAPGQGQQGQGQQSMQGMGDALSEQQNLADESFQELQRQFREGQESAQQGGDPPSEQELAERQEALRELMEQLQQSLPGEAGEEVRESLRETEQNMRKSRDELEQGDIAGALDSQADAIDGLREAMRELGEDMRRVDGGQGKDGAANGETESDNASTDPLGRPLGSRGGVGTNDRLLPDADAVARARAILDEIRRRVGEQVRPQIELDYLERLLDRF